MGRKNVIWVWFIGVKKVCNKHRVLVAKYKYCRKERKVNPHCPFGFCHSYNSISDPHKDKANALARRYSGLVVNNYNLHQSSSSVR